MKATGITRKIDELGRIVLPIELRRGLGIGEKDALEIYVEDEKLSLKNTSRLALSVEATRISLNSRASMFVLTASHSSRNN